MKKRYVFNIPGEPVRVFKSEDEGRQPLDTYMENKLRYRITFENQCENLDMINDPIEAIFKFFLPKNYKYRQSRVSIIELFKFANQTAQGIIYKKDYLLYNVKLEKEYSDYPHTEIVIRPLKKGTGNANQKKKKISS